MIVEALPEATDFGGRPRTPATTPAQQNLLAMQPPPPPPSEMLGSRDSFGYDAPAVQ